MIERYIKIDSNNNITNLFSWNIAQYFDGTQIYLDNVEDYNYLNTINGVDAFDQFNAPNFQYVEGKVVQSDKGLDISKYKAKWITDANSTATSTIYTSYPAYAQTNMIADATYASQVLANQLGLEIGAINASMNELVMRANNSVAELVAYKDCIPALDITNTVGKTCTSTQIKYYKTIMYSLIGYQMINYVRAWCNAKVSAINACTDISQVTAIVFTDVPAIS